MPASPIPRPQADFAQSAVDFLHRVGRTARAGKAGRVTSLFTPDAEPLVQAIRDNIAAGAYVFPWSSTCMTSPAAASLLLPAMSAEAGWFAVAESLCCGLRRCSSVCSQPCCLTLCHTALGLFCSFRPAGGGRFQPQALLPQEAQKVGCVCFRVPGCRGKGAQGQGCQDNGSFSSQQQLSPASLQAHSPRRC